MRTFNNATFVVFDSNGHRSELLIRDRQLSPAELIGQFAAFVGDISDASQWEGNVDITASELAEEDTQTRATEVAVGQTSQPLETIESGQILEDAKDSDGQSGQNQPD